MTDLLVLVPDADIEQAMYGLLVRADGIDIAPVDFEIRRHVNRDSGCRANAANFLRPYSKTYRHALVVFDRHGCGSRGTREEIQKQVEIDLARNGWENRSKARVIDPELEVWVWSRAPPVAEVLYPSRHWELDPSGQPTNRILPECRKVAFITPMPRPRKQKSIQQEKVLFDAAAQALGTGAQQYDLTAFIGGARDQVDRWRELPEPNAWSVTPETARLLTPPPFRRMD